VPRARDPRPVLAADGRPGGHDRACGDRRLRPPGEGAARAGRALRRGAPRGRALPHALVLPLPSLGAPVRPARAVPPARGRGPANRAVTTGAERHTARPSWEALVACVVFVACAVAITAVWELLGDAVTDIALYQAYGERVAAGLVPYRDFGFEYPPGALPAIVAPALVTSSLHAYRIVFVAEMALVGVLGLLVLDAALRRLHLLAARLS